MACMLICPDACKPGHQPNTDGTAGCEPCAMDEYKTEETADGEGWRDNCTACPDDKPHTRDTGSTMCIGKFGNIRCVIVETGATHMHRRMVKLFNGSTLNSTSDKKDTFVW